MTASRIKPLGWAPTPNLRIFVTKEGKEFLEMLWIQEKSPIATKHNVQWRRVPVVREQTIVTPK